MYLRTVLRSMPSCRAMADIVRPCRCRSRIIMSSPRVTTALLPPAKGSSIGGDGASPPHRKCPGRQAATTKLGKIRRPQLGRIQRPLTAKHGEKGLYVTLSESERELRLVAKRHGFSLEGLSIFELVPPEATLDPERELTLFHPAELELTETAKLIFDRVNEIKPSRIVFDSLSEMRLLAQNPLRYRRQVLALKHFFAGRRCSVLLLDDFSSQEGDIQLHSIAHGVIILQQLALDYGAERRRLRVKKMRGLKFRGGYHDFIIETGGIKVFPRLVAAEHHRAFLGEL